jgi:hypothetical protein
MTTTMMMIKTSTLTMTTMMTTAITIMMMIVTTTTMMIFDGGTAKDGTDCASRSGLLHRLLLKRIIAWPGIVEEEEEYNENDPFLPHSIQRAESVLFLKRPNVHLDHVEPAH